ncbi:MAG: hypothetical protein ABMA25_29430 [Ilumatobacteraceae bacterium]
MQEVFSEVFQNPYSSLHPRRSIADSIGRPLAIAGVDKREIAQRVAVMADGKIVELGTAADTLTNPQEEYTRRLLADTPAIPEFPANPEFSIDTLG